MDRACSHGHGRSMASLRNVGPSSRISVVVTGADGRTGRRLVPLLQSSPAVSSVVTVDASAPAAELKRAMGDGASALVHLGAATAIGGVLEAASSTAISTVVYRS